MKRASSNPKAKGYTLVTFAVCIFALIAVAGLAIDIGRIYIAKNEAQTFSDSAALAATLELDGTGAGISRARLQVSGNTNRWNLQTSSFTDPEVSFAKIATGPWELNPVNPAGYRYTRVVGNAAVPLSFLSILNTGQPAFAMPLGLLMLGSTLTVKGDSGAGQEPKNTFREGLFPFSPFAQNNVGPDFGLIPGQHYTLRWPSTPKVNQNTCPGDNTQAMVDLAQAGGGSERGYIESSSADLIRQTIVDDYQSVTRSIGDAVDMTGGAKQSQLDSLMTRIGQDADPTRSTFAAYSGAQMGNGRRMIAAPINTGYPNYRIVQIAAFLLLPTSEYKNGGSQPWCAEYVGAWVQGSKNKGAGTPGAYVARLTR
ncbi:MAG TPA: Tad domain-containing protein [Bryobacteraceae bacterium]|nr:Tad domain-containing protein [Bryobacteraceae bacterium]